MTEVSFSPRIVDVVSDPLHKRHSAAYGKRATVARKVRTVKMRVGGSGLSKQPHLVRMQPRFPMPGEGTRKRLQLTKRGRADT